MATRRKDRWLDGLNPQQELEIILKFVNGDAKYIRAWHSAAVQLRDFLKKWNASKVNMSVFIRDNPELWEAMQGRYKDNPPPLFPTYPDEDGLVLVWRFPAVVTRSLRSERQDMVSLSEMLPISPEALHLFISFLLNPLRHRLGGPCPRCGKYFLRRTNRNPKVYCSRDCGLKTTAKIAMKAKRDEEHSDKLQRARDAAQEWTKARTGKDWKSWVSARQPDISAKFLTRAVNNKEMKPPTKRGKP